MAESSLELIPPNLRYRFTDFRKVGRTLDPHIVLIETLEISGKSMAVATKNCTL